MRGKTRLTKLQQEYIEISTSHGDFVAYPNNIFQSDNYLKWRRKRRAKIVEKKITSTNSTMVPCPWYQGMWKPCVRSYLYDCKRAPCVYPAAQHQ